MKTHGLVILVFTAVAISASDFSDFLDELEDFEDFVISKTIRDIIDEKKVIDDPEIDEKYQLENFLEDLIARHLTRMKELEFDNKPVGEYLKRKIKRYKNVGFLPRFKRKYRSNTSRAHSQQLDFKPNCDYPRLLEKLECLQNKLHWFGHNSKNGIEEARYKRFENMFMQGL